MIIKGPDNDIQTIALGSISLQIGNQLSGALASRYRLVKVDFSGDYFDKMKNEKVHLVLIEVNDPSVRGFEAYRNLTLLCKDAGIPIIAIIGQNDVGKMAPGFHMGISDYIVSPIVQVEALARISSQINFAASRATLKYALNGFNGDSETFHNAEKDRHLAERILIVDDAIDGARSLARLLGDIFIVDVVHSGRDAINMLSEISYDLIVLDVVMPGLNGYEVCEILKSDPDTENIPIILLSGQSEDKLETFGLSVGAVDFIKKPVAFQNLKARIGKHLQTAKKLSYLDQLSYTDTLTGLPNRRRFEEQIDIECRRAERQHLNLAIVMIDVDEFKLFNDAFGHKAGDQCLQAVAGAMASASHRPGDLVCRLGGEEFVALLPNTDLSGAETYAEKLLKGVCELKIKHSPNAQNSVVTLSLGVASCVANDLERTNKLLFRADQMLYKAKSDGRNCVRSQELGDIHS